MANRYPLKGIHTVEAKGHTYYYAWRGGPRLRGQPGSPDFHASYNEAVADRQTPELGKFRSLVTIYKAGPFQKLAPSTQRMWGRWLDIIADHFGTLSIAQFERPEKVRPLIRQWRNKWANTPRAADMGMQVLSVVLNHAVDPLGKIAGNPCIGIKTLYSSDRSKIIWTDSDIISIKKVCSPEIAHAIDLAAATGLRRGDLLRLCWSHIGDDCIVISTSKSNHQREAIIPLYDGLRDVLARIPKRSPTVLTNRQRQPWIDGSFGVAINAAKKAAGLQRLHFHDLRGTAATQFYLAGLSERVIGEILGWTEDSVKNIIRKYVDRTAATKAVILQLNEKRK